MASKNFVVALDIGSSRTRAMAAYLKPDDSEIEVVAKASEPTFGVRKGVVMDPDTVSKVVTSVLEELEKHSGEFVNELLVSMGGGHMFSTVSEGTVVVSRADQVISEEDVERAMEAAKTLPLPKNRDILEVFPQEFVVDKEEGIREPVGMKGVRLQVKIVALAYFIPYFENLKEAVEQAGFKPVILPGPLMGGKAVLTSREKELGVLFLDIGAGMTGYCLFKEKVLLKAGVVPVGSDNITKDIAVGLQTDVDTAEKIKIQYGACYLGGRKRIKIKEERSGEELEFSHAQLGRIIDARTKEIFDMVKEKLVEADSPELPGGAVLTGGGSFLAGIDKMAKKQLGLAVRLGTPQGFFPSQEDPSLSTLCGLIVHGRERLNGRGLDTKLWIMKLKKALKSLVP